MPYPRLHTPSQVHTLAIMDITDIQLNYYGHMDSAGGGYVVVNTLFAPIVCVGFVFGPCFLIQDLVSCLPV